MCATKSKTTSTRYLCVGITFLIVLAADCASKAWIRSFLPSEAHWHDVIPGCLRLVHRLNPGIAFSLFHSVRGAPIVFSFVSVAALAFIIWLVYRYRALPWKVLLALGAIAGGAAGNLIDRVLPPHHVLDFIDCYVGAWHWPAFNVADSAICIGAGLLILASFTDPHSFSSQSSSHSSPDGEPSSR